VATAFAVGAAEPYMSGVGGSGAMTIWLEGEQRAEFLDFYAAQNADTWEAAFESGRLPVERTGPADLRIVGVPGNVAGLLAAHERFGKLPRAQVMAPAIRLAEEGFAVHQVMAEFVRRELPFGRFGRAEEVGAQTRLIDLRDDGSFRLNMEYFTYPAGLTMTGRRLAELFDMRQAERTTRYFFENLPQQAGVCRIVLDQQDLGQRFNH